MASDDVQGAELSVSKNDEGGIDTTLSVENTGNTNTDVVVVYKENIKGVVSRKTEIIPAEGVEFNRTFDPKDASFYGNVNMEAKVVDPTTGEVLTKDSATLNGQVDIQDARGALYLDDYVVNSKTTDDVIDVTVRVGNGSLSADYVTTVFITVGTLSSDDAYSPDSVQKTVVAGEIADFNFSIPYSKFPMTGDVDVTMTVKTSTTIGSGDPIASGVKTVNVPSGDGGGGDNGSTESGISGGAILAGGLAVTLLGALAYSQRDAISQAVETKTSQSGEGS